MGLGRVGLNPSLLEVCSASLAEQRGEGFESWCPSAGLEGLAPLTLDSVSLRFVAQSHGSWL